MDPRPNLAGESVNDNIAFDEELERSIKSIGIPSRPGILLELDAEVKKDDPDFRKIEKLVTGDVGLSAMLLKTVNSPFYGLRTKVGTINQVISVLGLSTLTRVITGLMLHKVFAASGQVSMERFWDASAKIAVTTAYIAHQLPGMNKEEAYTFGLFQDCGIPVLMQKYPNYKETLGIANQMLDRKFTDIEEDHHRTNHATVGYFLAKSWCLPEKIFKAILFHHEYTALSELPHESQDLVALALLAERAIQLNSGMAKSMEWSKGGMIALAHLGFSEEEYAEIVADIKAMREPT